MLKVPLDRTSDSLFKGCLRHPPEFSLNFCGVNSISPIMPEPIGDMGYESFMDIRIAGNLSDNFQDCFDDDDILLLI